MTEHAKQFSPRVFANFNKVYLPTEELAIKSTYIDPDRLVLTLT